MNFNDPFILVGYSVLMFALAFYGGYVLGKKHGQEDGFDYVNEFIRKYDFVSKNPVTYRCCEHCLLLDGEYNDEHWTQDSEGNSIRYFHFHPSPCTESWCYKGQLINTEDRNPDKEIDNG